MKFPLVKIIWRDIQPLSGDWMSLREAIENAKKSYKEKFETVGYLLERNADFLLVAGTVDYGREYYNDISLIPNKVVVSVEKL